MPLGRKYFGVIFPIRRLDRAGTYLFSQLVFLGDFGVTDFFVTDFFGALVLLRYIFCAFGVTAFIKP